MLLCQRVVVPRQVGEVGLDQGLRAGPAARVGAAEFALGAIAHDVVLLGRQGQRVEAGAGVDLDHARLQQRRLRVQRLAAHESGQGVGRVLDAVLPDVELTELLEDAELVALALRAVDVARHRLGALQVGQADAGDAEGVVEQLAVGAAERTHVLQPGLVAGQRAERTELEIEHAKERLQGVVEAAELEQGPALHVERTVGEGAALATGQQRGVGRLGLLVVAHGKEQFAAAEMRFVGMHGAGMLAHQQGQRVQRQLELAALLLRPRQLVEHAVAARVRGVGLEELLVARDGGPVVGHLGRGGGGLGRAAVRAVHLQVTQASHRLGALRRVGRRFQELAVGGDGLLFGHPARAARLISGDGDDAVAQAGQRGLVVAGQALVAGAGQQGGRQGQRRAAPPARAHQATYALRASVFVFRAAVQAHGLAPTAGADLSLRWASCARSRIWAIARRACAA